MRALKLVFLVGLLALAGIAHAQYYEYNASGAVNSELAQSTVGTVTNVTASSTATVALFSALAGNTYYTHALVRIKNGTTVYFNPTSLATPSTGLAFTSSDGLWKFPLTDEVKNFTVIGDSGGETVDYMPIKEE